MGRTREGLNNNLRCPLRNASTSVGLYERFRPSCEAFRKSSGGVGVAYGDLSRSARGLLGGLNIGLHSDWSGNGGRADRGIPFGLGVEVEYGKEPEAVSRVLPTRVEETDTDAWLKPERETRLSDDLETRDAVSIVLLDLALGSVTE